MRTMEGDQRTARECYLVSICPLLERTIERGGTGPPLSDKKPWSGPPPTMAEALVVHTMASAEPERLRPVATDGVEQVPTDKERPERTVRLGKAVEAPT